MKRLRELYPAAQILSLDYDPDVSFANVENRLQMLVMNVRESKEAQARDIDIEEVSQAVDSVAEQAGDLAESVLRSSNDLEKPDQITLEHIEFVAKAMREVLEREDLLAARAKDALVSARKAAQQGASDAAEVVIARALAASELAREMRTRTRTSLNALGEAAEVLSESGDKALEHVQYEVAARIEEGRAFAARVSAQAREFIERPR